MISGLQATAATIVAEIVTVDADPVPAGPPSLLSTIDEIVSLLSVGAMVLLLGWLALRPGRDPLANAPQRPNRLREDALAVAVIVYLLSSLLLQGVIGFAFGDELTAASKVASGLSVSCVGIAVCLWIAGQQFDGGVRRFLLGNESIGSRASVTLIGGLSLMAIGLCPIVRDAVARSILYFMPDFEFASHPTIEALHDPTQPLIMTAALWVGAVVLAPVSEELFFRGLLQTFLIRVVRHRWIAILLTSIAFGAVHFFQPHAVLALAVLSVLIGFAYERTGSLVAPILIHALFNLKTMVWDALGAYPALTPLCN